MISTDAIWKEYPDKLLFKNLSLKLKEGMRVGLVGPNGAGKSTLLKILLGIESPDKGRVEMGKHISIGYLPQEIIAGSEKNVIEESLASFPEISKLENKIFLINNKLSNNPNNTKLLSELSSLHDTFDQLGGWDIEKKAKIILGGLGFSEDQLYQEFNTFSGGWRMRCYLSGLLLKQPNYLFLDEPTNHLDLQAVLWMENFLSSWRGGLIMISHDRSFLDKSVNTILELQKGKATLYSGNYSFYIEKREELRRHQEKIYNNQQKTIAQTERFIERFRAKNTKSKQVQSRIKQLEKLEPIDPVENEGKRITIRIPQPDRGPLKVADLTNVNKSFGKNSVYKNLDLTIERGQKIALVGENGSGKSTLLKMLAGVESPTSGAITFGPKVRAHYFAQHQLESLDINETIYQTVSSISHGWTETQIRSYLGSFLFSSDTIEKKVKVLSGGEKSRLALARLLVEPSHLLLLDEPTNHLDIQSRDIIENALQSYSGTLVCISHDRHFLNLVTNHTIEVQKECIKHFAGNYDYFIWKSEKNESNISKEISSKEPPKKQSIYKENKIRKNELKRIGKRLTEIDKELKIINNDLIDEKNSSDYEKLQSLSNAQNQLESEYFELIERQETLQKLSIEL